TADVNPLHAHARLTVAFKRLAQFRRAGLTSGLTGIGAMSLAAAQAILESPASRRAGPQFSREVTTLVEMAAQFIEGGAPVDELLGPVAERLRRAVPARSVRIVDTLARGVVQTPDA